MRVVSESVRIINSHSTTRPRKAHAQDPMSRPNQAGDSLMGRRGNFALTMVAHGCLVRPFDYPSPLEVQSFGLDRRVDQESDQSRFDR